MSDSPADRSTHTIPCLGYTDARAAIAWLRDVLGAHVEHVYDGPDDTVAHAELWFGRSCVMCGSIKGANVPPRVAGETSLYIVMEDAAAVDALHARAVAGGARIAISLRDTDYGSHDFACLDPEGNAWCFGTYAPERSAQPDAAVSDAAMSGAAGPDAAR